MKKAPFITWVVLFSLFMLTSCSTGLRIEQRKYRDGFYVAGSDRHVQKGGTTVSAPLAVSKPARVEQPANGEPQPLAYRIEMPPAIAQPQTVPHNAGVFSEALSKSKKIVSIHRLQVQHKALLHHPDRGFACSKKLEKESPAVLGVLMLIFGIFLLILLIVAMVKVMKGAIDVCFGGGGMY